MEIEVKKVKLTKSLLTQMPWVGKDNTALINGTVLGYVQGIIKHSSSAMIIEYSNEFYLCGINWIKTNTSMYYYCNKQKYVLYFDTPSECTTYWGHYMKCKLEAEKNHIYL